MSAHVFSEIPRINTPRSIFRRNFNLKTTLGTDYLYPIYVDEALPGDSFKMKAHLFARLSTPVVPIMDNLYLDTFFFAVPVRLVDKDFKKLMGERPFGDIRNDYTVPQLNSGANGVAFGSLSDYMGIPPGVKKLEFCAWWHRAYNLIYNDWFRDENLCPARPIAGVHEDGTVTTEALSDYVLCKRGKRKDYFTGCLPWPQKGSAAAFDFGTAYISNWDDNHTSMDGATYFSPKLYQANSSDGFDAVSTAGAAGVNPQGYFTHNDAGAIPTNRKQSYMALDVVFSSQTMLSVNQLREAFALQHLLERDALGGTRYTELVLAHFNVHSPDARQQRPEYLGGASVPLNVTTVAQTSASESTGTPQGNLAAFVTANSNDFWTKSFTEHTLIIGLCNVRADLSYQQGLPRMFSRKTKYDFYWPELANLGEQAVLNKEIYAQGADVVGTGGEPEDENVFGYQERWAEYRYHPNMITGLFRSTYSQSLDVWHLAQKFNSLPILGQTFIEESVPINRVVAVTNEPPLILDGWFEVKCARPMPVYSVPGLSRL